MRRLLSRRGLLSGLAAVAAAMAASLLFGAGAAIDAGNQAPATTAGPLRPKPRIERYGWMDVYGNQTIGYRKIWPGTPEYQATEAQLNWGCP